MYKIASLGLIAVLAIMIVPASFESSSNDRASFYGYSVLSVMDISGVTVFESGLHNEVINEGVQFLLNSATDDGNAGPAQADSINAICIDVDVQPISNLFSSTNETITFATFNDNDGDTDDDNLNCEPVTFTATTANADGSDGNTVSTTANFAAGSDNMEDGQIIVGIAICNNASVVADFNCDAALLAMIDTADVTVGAGETVDITYTLNLD